MRSFLAIAGFLLMGLTACTKDNGDDTLDGRFQGLWIESSNDNIRIVVSTDNLDFAGRNMFLFVDDSGTGYPIDYELNAAGDSIYITSGSEEERIRQPHKIDFSVNRRVFTIEKFHHGLPDKEVFTFNKKH